jgi:acetoin utilization protein AcuB
MAYLGGQSRLNEGEMDAQLLRVLACRSVATMGPADPEESPMTSVQEIMTRDVAFVGANATIADALQVMHDADIRHVPVLEDGELIGILSDRDLRMLAPWWRSGDSEAAEVSPPLARAVSSVMSSDVQTVTADDDVVDAVDLMIDHKIGAVPVIDPNTRELLGIVSYVDALRVARARM